MGVGIQLLPFIVLIAFIPTILYRPVGGHSNNTEKAPVAPSEDPIHYMKAWLYDGPTDWFECRTCGASRMPGSEIGQLKIPTGED